MWNMVLMFHVKHWMVILMARLKLAEGEKWEDYLYLPEMRNYGRDEVEAVVRRLTTGANKRLKAIKKKGYTDSPSYQNVQDQYKDAKFPTKFSKMTRNQLLQQYTRLNWFLDNKTATVRGYEKVQKDFETAIGFKMNVDQRDNFWRVYSRLFEDTSIRNEMLQLSSTQIFQNVAEMITQPNISSEDLDKIFSTMKARIENEYRWKTNQYATDSQLAGKMDKATVERLKKFRRLK